MKKKDIELIQIGYFDGTTCSRSARGRCGSLGTWYGQPKPLTLMKIVMLYRNRYDAIWIPGWTAWSGIRSPREEVT
jgi:hypothetical protein